jgi:hypothetical protein
MQKIAIKAWYAPEPPARYLNHEIYKDSFGNKQHYIRYRYLMGYVFIFALKWNRAALDPQKKLITVYN